MFGYRENIEVSLGLVPNCNIKANCMCWSRRSRLVRRPGLRTVGWCDARAQFNEESWRINISRIIPRWCNLMLVHHGRASLQS